MTFACFILGLLPYSFGAAEASATTEKVQSLLKERCGACHGPLDPKGGLNLLSLEGITRGGEGGRVVSPGKPDSSPLWERVRDQEMPPKKPLAPQEAALLRIWIEGGAHGVGAKKHTDSASQDHWAFRPPVAPPIPKIRGEKSARNDVDRLLLARLEAKGLGYAPEADRATLIRRVSFALTGLPPSLDEIASFLADPSLDAFERMVDRYLDSPAYGERWGKHWLDAAGYCDSNGYFNADTDRPLAYRYRDYVVRSTQSDKPFDQFIREQLAGDEIVGFQSGGDVSPEMVDPLIATHFWRNAPDGTGESDGNPEELRVDRYSVIEGSLQVVMSSLLGVTIQCARCHNHKFEPITQEEYYGLQAILRPAYDPEHWLKPKERVLQIGLRKEREEHARRSAAVDAQVKALKVGLESVEASLRRQFLEERLSSAPTAERDTVITAALAPDKKQNAEQKKLLEKHAIAVAISDEELAKRFAEWAALRKSTEQMIAGREKDRPAPLPEIAALTNVHSTAPVHHVLERGQYTSPGKAAPPVAPAALSTGGRYRPPPAAAGRRLAFATWVASPNNPLFARVTVNRVWQKHFGTGVVATVENLGLSGAAPSHPELVDLLAVRFAADGWSLKKLHRLIMLSAAYRQQSGFRSDAAAVDPANRLLWRFPLLRLDAESVRDSMLAASGELDRTIGGPYVPTQRLPDGNVTADGLRRSIYLQQRRTQVTTFLELFDAPSIVTNCTARGASTVPLQSLAQLNSQFAVDRAKAFAQRVAREAQGDDRRLERMFLLSYGRGPRPDERKAAVEFLDAQRSIYRAAKVAPETLESKTWSDLAQMVLASNAFLYVE